MLKRNKINSLMMIVAVFAFILGQTALATPETVATSNGTKTDTANNQSDLSKNLVKNLYRADFCVTGVSCPVCLRRIGVTLRQQKGVIMADVSIFQPSWAVVIYDKNEVNLEKLAQSVSKEKVKFEAIEDKQITEIPTVVVPKMVGRL